MSAATTFRARATLTVSGVQCLVTTYWDDVAIVGGAALATEALARVRACFNSLAGLIVAGSTIAFDTSVVQLNPTTGQATAAFTGAAPAAVTFTGSGDPLPFQTQALVRYGTGVFVRGRRLIGRTFVPGLLESSSTSGIGPSSALQTSLNTAFGLLGTTVVSNINQIVWSRPNPAVPGSGQSEPVTSRSASATWAVQTGRRP